MPFDRSTLFRYQCRDCNHKFDNPDYQKDLPIPLKIRGFAICPRCGSSDFGEYKDPRYEEYLNDRW